MSNLKDTFKSKTVKLNMGKIAHLDSDKLEMFKRAYVHKDFIIGENETRHGLEADYSHLDFMLAHKNLFSEMPADTSTWNELMYLEVFWAKLWEYLAHLFASFEKLSNKFELVIRENDDIVAKHARLKYKHDYMEEFIKGLGKKVDVEFHNGFFEAKKDFDKKVAEIVKSQQENED